MARLPLPDPDEFVDDLADLPDSMEIGTQNITRALGNNPPALVAASTYVSALYELLPPTVREVVILAVAREKDSTYEWHQHVRIARDAGVSPGTIRAIGAEDPESLDAADRTVVEFVRAQCRGGVTDALFDALADHFSTEDVVAISRVAANYAGTADFIAAMDVTIDEPFVGWVPTN